MFGLCLWSINPGPVKLLQRRPLCHNPDDLRPAPALALAPRPNNSHGSGTHTHTHRLLAAVEAHLGCWGLDVSRFLRLPDIREPHGNDNESQDKILHDSESGRGTGLSALCVVEVCSKVTNAKQSEFI